MLKPAQMYADRLRKAELENWYKPENIFWNGGSGDCYISLPDNNYERHCFVSVDSSDNIIGYISYAVDWAAMSADRFGAISFHKGNIGFARDLYIAICNIFEVYHLNRMEWHCFADNPAISSYRRFIERHGGRECSYLRQVSRLQDGKLHDSVGFEIMASEFKRRG